MPIRRPDIGFIPTPNEVIEAILTLGNIQKSDVVYDLGCGDGRILIHIAQQTGAQGIGIDIDSDRIQEATQNAQVADVAHLVRFYQQDLYESEFEDATVVVLYLLPHLNLKLRPKLMQLSPGTRIISHDFDMGDWSPDETVQVPFLEDEIATLYKWTVS